MAILHLQQTYLKNFKNLFLNTSTGWGFSTGTRAPDAKTSSAAAGARPSPRAIQVTVTILMLSQEHSPFTSLTIMLIAKSQCKIIYHLQRKVTIKEVQLNH